MKVLFSSRNADPRLKTGQLKCNSSKAVKIRMVMETEQPENGAMSELSWKMFIMNVTKMIATLTKYSTATVNQMHRVAFTYLFKIWTLQWYKCK